MADSDHKKLSRQQQAIVFALKDGPKTNVELNEICFRYGARIWDLRQIGYGITHSYIEPGLYLYTLISEPCNGGQIRLAV